AVAANSKMLGLIVQGMADPAGAAAEVNRIADDYGQREWTWDPKVSWLPVLGPGRLGQVVIAGHGEATRVEMGSPGTGAWADETNHRVGYDGNDIDRKDPTKNGTELLFDTVIKRMDPKDVDIVFAGCLVASHDVPKDTKVGANSAQAQKNLQAAIAAHPNLAEYVKSRIAVASATGKVTAANASATFDSFQVDPVTGKMGIDKPTEPKLGGTKLEYVQQGKEPEGALRAAIECFADPAIGPAKVTTEIRARVTALAASTDWWEVITRVGFELCLPGKGDVDAHKLLDVVSRIGRWFDMLWDNTSDVGAAASNTKPGEAKKVYAGMLSTANAGEAHIAVGANEAWMKFDASKGTPFMAALTASGFTRDTFKKFLVRSIVDPQLAKLVPTTASPSVGQLLLALSIASQAGKSMPLAVRNMLRAAAGGKKTTTFPVALGVPALLAPYPESQILDDIGLGTSAPVVVAKGPPTIDGNVDANADGKNETYIDVSPHGASVLAADLPVHSKPSTSAPVIATLHKPDQVQVMGKTEDGTWAMIDQGGARGFVISKSITE
ncbi:MAG TPA: SH3 domain-containing protein, partial [Kofleriaceae bacterium]|nr:SH3 domain-containing protein [Kofleriaceae bacterium]